MIDGSPAIHPHHLGLLMLLGISSTGALSQAKKCVINAFDTNTIMFADEVMASILHMAQDTEEELPGAELTTPCGLALRS
jgi:hypothetical protein